jgi:hypothetical protein
MTRRAWLIVALGVALLTILDGSYTTISHGSAPGPVVALISEGFDHVERFAEHHEKLLIIVLTAAIALFTATLWRSTDAMQRIAQQQLADMKRSLAIGEETARAARNQSEAILRTERAYVKMSPMKPGIKFHPSGQGFEIALEIKNWGRTPATVTDAVVNELVLSMREVLPEVPRYMRGKIDETIRTVLAAGDHVNLLQTFAIPVERSALASGEKSLVIYGYVDYVDAFGQRHRAGYAGVSEASSRGDNLQFVMQPEYNYDRERKVGEGNDWVDLPMLRFDETLSVKESA